MAELIDRGFVITSSHYDLSGKDPECRTPCDRNSIDLNEISSKFPDRLSLTFYSCDTRGNGVPSVVLFDFHRSNYHVWLAKCASWQGYKI